MRFVFCRSYTLLEAKALKPTYARLHNVTETVKELKRNIEGKLAQMQVVSGLANVKHCVSYDIT